MNEQEEGGNGEAFTGDPIIEMAMRSPPRVIRSLKASMLCGITGSVTVFTVSVAALFAYWKPWGNCERPLRWWLLVQALLQLLQVPMRAVVLAALWQIDTTTDPILHMSALVSETAWRLSRCVSLISYAWLVLGIVWTLNASSCTSCPWLLEVTFVVVAQSILRIMCAWASFRISLSQGANLQSEELAVDAASSDQIEALPLVCVSAEALARNSGQSCAVCLSEYREAEFQRVLPCGHRFHQRCGDQWLARSKRCPLCMRAIQVGDHSRFCTCLRRLKAQ